MFRGSQGHLPKLGLIRANRPKQPFPCGQIELFGPLGGDRAQVPAVTGRGTNQWDSAEGFKRCGKIAGRVPAAGRNFSHSEPPLGELIIPVFAENEKLAGDIFLGNGRKKRFQRRRYPVETRRMDV